MATTLPQSTLHSSHNHFSSQVFIGVGGVVAAGIVSAESSQKADTTSGERDCQPRVELCLTADKLRLPDGSEKDPSNPLDKLTTGTVATSSAAPLTSSTTVVVSTTAAK